MQTQGTSPAVLHRTAPPHKNAQTRADRGTRAEVRLDESPSPLGKNLVVGRKQDSLKVPRSKEFNTAKDLLFADHARAKLIKKSQPTYRYSKEHVPLRLLASLSAPPPLSLLSPKPPSTRRPLRPGPPRQQPSRRPKTASETKRAVLDGRGNTWVGGWAGGWVGVRGSHDGVLRPSRRLLMAKVVTRERGCMHEGGGSVIN